MGATTAEVIDDFMKKMAEFLKEKNKRYGNSALSPVKIFCKDGTVDLIDVRLDDKMSRIINSAEVRENDVYDLIGYLVLKCIKNGWFNPSLFLD